MRPIAPGPGTTGSSSRYFRSPLRTSLAYASTRLAATSTMTSPVPRSGSGTVSIASGDPNAFSTAAFIGPPHFGEAAFSRAFRVSTRPGIILGLFRPLLRHGAYGGIRHEFEAKRTRRLPAIAAAEADAEGGWPAGGLAAAHTRPA